MKKHQIEQRSPEWFQIRKGKITGTVLKGIMGTPYAKQEMFYELIAQRLIVGLVNDGENPMERGIRLEDEAIAKFEFETGLKVEKVGFAESDNPVIANSPDGLIGDTEAIEVKCMGGKNHIKLWFENEIPKEYNWQVIQYFIVNPKLEKMYFVGYNPDMPVHPIHIIEVKRNEVEDKIKLAETAQEEFIKVVNEKLREIIKL